MKQGTIHRDAESGRKNAPDLIITGGTVLTMVKDEKPMAAGRVEIVDGIIEDIVPPDPAGAGGEARAAEQIDADGCLVLPGLVNAHTHAAMTLLRGYADDMALKEWLFEKIFPAEALHVNPESVYWGTLLACLEMIASGTTCFADGYFYEDAAARAALHAGLRAVVTQGVIDFPAPGVPDPRDNMRVVREFIERWHGVSETITPGVFCHSPLTCSKDTLIGALGIAGESGTKLHIHLSETMEEVLNITENTGKRPVYYLDQLGLINKSIVAVHAVHLDEGELDLIAGKGTGLVHVPGSNMKLCSGAADVVSMIRKGLLPGLGTDGASSNNNLDMFTEMDTAAKLSKVLCNDPVGLEAETALRMATIGGAQILGLEKEIGTLERGKRADVIVIDLRNPRLCPMYDPFSALVYAADGSDVRDVVVNGKILMRDRTFTALDARAIMEKVKDISTTIAG